MADAREDIWAALEAADSCMLVDRVGEKLRARPMQPFADRSDHAVWFITDRTSAKADEVQQAPEVCVTLSRPGKYRFVSISGRAEIVDDREKLKALWTSSNNAWFDGPDDPRAVLLKVEPQEGQIWEGPGAPVGVAELWFSAVIGGAPDAMRRADKAQL